jgi:prostaglandin-E synthase
MASYFTGSLIFFIHLFSGERDSLTFVVDFQLFDEINVETSKYSTKGRNVIFNIMKKNVGPFWPRLIKDTKKEQTIKSDWDKWADEDEEEKKPGADWDPDQMNSTSL